MFSDYRRLSYSSLHYACIVFLRLNAAAIILQDKILPFGPLNTRLPTNLKSTYYKNRQTS
jgi:hypothetical protein